VHAAVRAQAVSAAVRSALIAAAALSLDQATDRALAALAELDGSQPIAVHPGVRL